MDWSMRESGRTISRTTVESGTSERRNAGCLEIVCCTGQRSALCTQTAITTTVFMWMARNKVSESLVGVTAVNT